MNHSMEIISAETAQTLDGLFCRRVQLSTKQIAFQRYLRDAKKWQQYSWQDMAQQVAAWQAALKTENLDSGDRISILLPNSPDWVAIEQAALGLGLVVVPLYVDDRAENAAYILQDAGVKILFVQDVNRWQQIKDADAKCHSSLQRVIALDDNPNFITTDPDEELVRYANGWLPTETCLLQQRQGDPHELATIVYTSGTTGRPKGVMLSHFNILFVADAVIKALGIQPKQLVLSFLPLSHMFERTVGYYAPMMCGMTIVYARSIQALADDLLTFKPDILIAVPRIFERIYDRVYQNLEKKSWLSRLLFNATVYVGWRRFLLQQGKRSSRLSQLFWPLLKKLVADKIMQKMGGNLKLAASGGASLPEPVAKIFIGMGLNLLQGYGMTETSPIISANQPQNNNPASVGFALPGIEIKTDEKNQLLVKSPGNMLGYWNNQTATDEIIDPQGWLQTGDVVRIENEQIYITGRIKDILVLSNGEKIPPTDMESAIILHPYFEQALLIGEARAYLSLLVVLNNECWPQLVNKLSSEGGHTSQLQQRELHATLLKVISQQLKNFPGYAKIRRICPLLDAWTINNGLLTPTLKIKRPEVLKKFHAEIEKMYGK